MSRVPGVLRLLRLVHVDMNQIQMYIFYIKSFSSVDVREDSSQTTGGLELL